ncbi:MAG: hypothetical protein RLZZ458_3685, partial [Planctomycetota bacterium]
SADTASGESFKWPSWLPIRVTEVGIQWENINTHPERFSLLVSASVEELKGIPGVVVSGAVRGIRIDIGELLDGNFPITDIESIAVSMKGELFGGEISAALMGGILKLADNGQIIDSSDTTTAVADRVFFLGVQGGFKIADKGGFSIRFAISELGPLGVEVVGDLPEGILLEPISGLKLSGFSGGVQFFSSLPDVYDPERLLDPEFAPKLSTGGSISPSAWLEKVRKQVAAQYKATKDSPVAGGFFAAFLSPMVISGGAQFTLHPPKSTLKGNVEVRLATDGKILLTGDILLLEGLQRVPARIYGNLSQIAKGNATLLLMARDIPAGPHPFLPPIPVPLPVGPAAIPIPTSVEIRGGISMRYYDSSGQQVDFYVDEDSSTTGKVQLYSPAPEGRTSVGTLLKDRELRVKFTPSPNAKLDLQSITDAGSEVQLVLPDGTAVEIPGAATQDTTSDNIFIYKIPASAELTTGEYTVRFLADAWKDSNEKTSAATTAVFQATGAQVQLAGPAAGDRFDRKRLNLAGRLALRFLPTDGSSIVLDSITDAATEFTLAGTGLGTAVLSGVPVRDTDDDRLFYFPFTGQFAPGTVEVTIAADAFQDSSGSKNPAITRIFTVTAAEAALVDPQPNALISAPLLNERGYIDVRFTTSAGTAIDPASIMDAGAEFELAGAAATGVTLNGVPTAIADQAGVYRYTFTGQFGSGPVELLFTAGTFLDLEAVPNASFVQRFTASGVTAEILGVAADQTVGLPLLNARGYFDVRYTASTGATIDPALLGDTQAEFVLAGSAAAGVELSTAPPVLQADGSYRYLFTGEFTAGDVSVTWERTGLQDSAGYSLTPGQIRFYVDSPQVMLLAPANEQRFDMGDLNDNGYIDIKFVDATGRGLNIASITDTDQEFSLLVKNESGEWEAPQGVGVLGAGEVVGDPDDLTFRYYFSGSFVPGVVRVQFAENSFQDLDGAGNAAAEQQFAVVANAPAFEIRVDGSYRWRTGFSQGLFGNLGDPKQLRDLLKMVEQVIGSLGDDVEASLQMLSDALGLLDTGLEFIQPFLDEPLMVINGFVRMGTEAIQGTADPATGSRPIIGARTSLDASGSMYVFFLGPVGAAAARVVLEVGEMGLNLWGVAELQAELKALRKFGIDARAFASLQFNTSTATQTETLTLEGMGENGDDLTRVYEIDPVSFMLAVAGKLVMHVPDFNDDDTFGTELFGLRGAFSMQISADGLEVLAVASMEIGPPDLQLFDLDAVGVLVINDQGFAT